MAGKAFTPRDYYEAEGMSTKDFVKQMRETFPKFSFTANSLANHPTQTGVTLTTAARSTLKPVREEKRAKTHRYSVRLDDANAELFESFLSKTGKSAQTAIEGFILACLSMYLNSEEFELNERSL